MKNNPTKSDLSSWITVAIYTLEHTLYTINPRTETPYYLAFLESSTIAATASRRGTSIGRGRHNRNASALFR